MLWCWYHKKIVYLVYSQFLGMGRALVPLFIYCACWLDILIFKTLKNNIHLWYRPIFTLAFGYNLILLPFLYKGAGSISALYVILSLILYIKYKEGVHRISTVIGQIFFLTRPLFWLSIILLIIASYFKKTSDFILLSPFFIIPLSLAALDDVQISRKVESDIAKIFLFVIMLLVPLVIVELIEQIYGLGLGITRPYSL